MILQTGQRTDIPAFYGRWFINRVKAGFVDVRNPYHPNQITRYKSIIILLMASLFVLKIHCHLYSICRLLLTTTNIGI